MVTPIARATGKISIHPAERWCDRNPAPRKGPRHRCGLRAAAIAHAASRASGFLTSQIEEQIVQPAAHVIWSQLVVILMSANPNPEEGVAFDKATDRAIMIAYSR